MESEIIGNCGAEGETRAYQPGVDGLIEAMGLEGDTKSIWDPENKDEVEAAQATYDRLISKGYTAYTVTDEKGEKGEKINKFDPGAGRMILVPRMMGG